MTRINRFNHKIQNFEVEERVPPGGNLQWQKWLCLNRTSLGLKWGYLLPTWHGFCYGQLSTTQSWRNLVNCLFQGPNMLACRCIFRTTPVLFSVKHHIQGNIILNSIFHKSFAWLMLESKPRLYCFWGRRDWVATSLSICVHQVICIVHCAGCCH